MRRTTVLLADDHAIVAEGLHDTLYSVRPIIRFHPHGAFGIFVCYPDGEDQP